MASERQVYDALEEQHINTFMNVLIAEAGDRPICELDLDKAVAAAHDGLDRIKDVAKPPEFDLGDLWTVSRSSWQISTHLSKQTLWTQGGALRSDLNAHSRQQNAKSTEKKRALPSKPNSDLCGPRTLSTLTRSARWNPRNGRWSTSHTVSTCGVCSVSERRR